MTDRFVHSRTFIVPKRPLSIHFHFLFFRLRHVYNGGKIEKNSRTGQINLEIGSDIKWILFVFSMGYRRNLFLKLPLEQQKNERKRTVLNNELFRHHQVKSTIAKIEHH